MSGLAVASAGPLTTVQDLGRPGVADIGVSGSGALDRGALRLANRLVGNSEDAAGLEITVGGFSAVIETDAWIAVTGAWGVVTVAGHPIDPNHPVEVAAGSLLEIGAATSGLRYYLAVRGGIDVAPVLGSRSRDVLAGLGPAPLADGDRLAVGGQIAGPVPVLDVAPWSPPRLGPVDVLVRVGPREDWFAASAVDALFATTWRLSAASNRVGARLDGPPLERLDRGELPSEGMVAGAIQVPPSGQPTVLLADHPVTGGYPVIAVVASAALDVFAQLRPGQELRFRHAR
ncbi:MAG: biotin-dependent carboxyltransferase family protein [Mycetocola sp.]